VDGDGRVTKKDLFAFLKELLGEENEVDYEKLIEIIFDEIVNNEKREYIDFEEFTRVMWTTNIDKSCTIDFTTRYN
jgi:Ca2+-binding EF-hand superfamily protein